MLNDIVSVILSFVTLASCVFGLYSALAPLVNMKRTNMTISNPDIVQVIEARLTDCRCYGLPVDPAGFKPCGGCEHDKHCLDEIVRLRAERDEARRNEVNRLSSAVRLKGWICFEEKTP